MFSQEQKEYALEGIEWNDVSFIDNQHIIDLIDHQREISIFMLLDDQFKLRTAGNDELLYNNMNQKLNGRTCYTKPKGGFKKLFTISHYAGNVQYDCDGFVDKNKDSVSDQIKALMA